MASVQQRGASTSTAQGVSQFTAKQAQDAQIDFFQDDQRPVILFDGVCNMCNGFVQLMLDWDTKAAFRLAALQSGAGRALLKRCGRHPDDLSSIVLVEKDGHFIRSSAVFKIGAGLPPPTTWLFTPLFYLIPRFVSDVAYNIVANNRYSVFGKSASCRMPDPKYKSRFLVAPELEGDNNA